MKRIPSNCFLLGLGLLFLLGCQLHTPDVSHLTNELAENKARTENLLTLLADNCETNRQAMNKALLAYGEVRAKQNKLINQIASDIRRSTAFSDHTQIERYYHLLAEDFTTAFAEFEDLAENNIANGCSSSGLVPTGAGLSLDLGPVVAAIYEELKGTAYKESVIRELQELKLKNYEAVLGTKLQNTPVELLD